MSCIEDVFCSGRVKILRELSSVEGLTVNEISKRTGLGYYTVVGHLRILKIANIVVAKALGKCRLYMFNEDSSRAMKLRQFLVAYAMTK